MPVIPYFDPDRMSKEVLPQESLLLVLGAPFASCFATLGLLLFTSAVPTLLLLRSTQDSLTLALLRAYRAGILLTCIAAVLVPFLFAALDILLFRRWQRKLEKGSVLLSVLPFSFLSLVLLVGVTACAWGICLWRAGLPGLYIQYGSEIQQVESGNLEHMTVLLDEGSIPDQMPGAQSDEMTLHRRGAVGPDSGWEWITLRIPDGLDFKPIPQSFPIIGQTWGWNWDNKQKYEVFYTSEFHLVESIVPVP